MMRLYIVETLPMCRD